MILISLCRHKGIARGVRWEATGGASCWRGGWPTGYPRGACWQCCAAALIQSKFIVDLEPDVFHFWVSKLASKSFDKLIVARGFKS